MLVNVRKPVLGVIGVLAMLAAAPATADVKVGVDAWSRGDYTAAVREWEDPAAAGDVDAMFNLGQAYRLGRGVPVDLARAEALYSTAAASGHLQAADTYGLMLFQDGRRDAALPYLKDAARRGDPRSQYLLGIAHFNGDMLERDWARAYALVMLANSSGLPQARGAIAQMDQHIPLTMRQVAAGLAVTMKREADGARAREVAAADLAAADLGVSDNVPAAPGPLPQRTQTPPLASSAMSVPRPIPSTAVSPSVAAARAAVAEASEAAGTENPADAGASYASAGELAPAPVAAPVWVARIPSAPTAPEPAPAPAPVPALAPTAPAQVAASNGPWKVQLGAFSVGGGAERLWASLSGRSELAGKQRLLVPAGRVTKLLAGGYATRADAIAACTSLKGAGQDCLVTR